MIQQFLKAGGVRTIEEFYKKFPTKKSFQNYMKMGGGLYAYQGGGQSGLPPNSADYVDQPEAYQAAMDEWMASLPTNQRQPLTPFARPTSGVPSYADYMRSMLASAPQQAGIPVLPATPIAAGPMPHFGLAAYEGPSIVDFLKMQGKSSSKVDRKRLAESLGIKNYTGTASQNRELLATIQENPDVLLDYTPGDNKEVAKIVGKKKAKEVMETHYPGDGRFIRSYGPFPKVGPPFLGLADGSATIGIPGMDNIYQSNRLDNIGMPAGSVSNALGYGAPSAGNRTFGPAAGIATGIAGGLAAAGLTAVDLIGVNFDKIPMAPSIKRKLTMARKKLLEEANKISLSKGKAAAAEFLKSPKKMQRILDNLDAMEITGDIYTMRSGTAMRNLEALKMQQEAAAEQLLANYGETGKMLDEASDEAKILRSLKAKKAAAIRWGKPVPKFPVQEIESAANLPSANALRRAWEAAGETPWLKTLGKFVRRAPKLQEGGDPDSMLEDVVEVFDPTGISSWDDAYRAWRDPNASWLQKGFATFSALPLVGGLARGTKGASTVARAVKPVSKVRKAMNVAGKGLHYASGIPAMKFLEHYNPAARFFTSLTGQATRQFPKLAQSGARLVSDLGRSERFFNSLIPSVGAGVNAMIPAAPQANSIRLIRPDGSVINTTVADPRVRDWMNNNAIDTTSGGWDENLGGWRLKSGTPYNYRQMGGDDSYSGTYSGGVYYKHGGMHDQWGGEFQKGGEYDLTDDEIQDLIDKGYKIEYL